jgi:hypothetical protein
MICAGWPSPPAMIGNGSTVTITSSAPLHPQMPSEAQDVASADEEKKWADIGFKADCISTMLSIHLQQKKLVNNPRQEESRLRGPFDGLPHHALCDARSQGRLFLNLAKELGLEL